MAASHAAVEESLLKAVADLQIRAQVESCVQELVTDVELATQLHAQLEQRYRTSQLERQLQVQQVAIEESIALKQQTQSQQTELADKLVQELWDLSRQIGTLQKIKLEHEALLADYDEVTARLLQTEEDLEEARAGRLRAASLAEEEKEKALKEAETKDAAEKIETPEETVSKDTVPTETQAPEPEIVGDVKIEEPKEEAKPREETTGEEADTAATPPAAVVTIDEESDEDEPPTLEGLDTEIIMHIFGYLDALDILNTAQVNVSMYSRVDALFGLGGGGHEVSDNSTIATAETPTTAPSTAPSRSTAATAGGSGAKTVTKVTTTTITTTPPPPRPKQPPTNQSSTVSAPPDLLAPEHGRSESSDSLLGPRGLLYFLQPRKTTQSATSSSPTASRRRQDTSAQPMNAAMANSMASKLTDAELNAIILMTERLKQKEALAERLTKENQEVAAKLDGTEAVKQFLIAKVRDIELSLTKQEDNETKVAQQIASDQEVIAFLDGRVQELERETKNLRQEKEATDAELERVRQQTEKKSVVMGDMLQFERERLTESEREWKATKKLLIKEVKNCRAQIVALQAERDGYREQNEILRKAVLSSHSGSGSYRERAYT